MSRLLLLALVAGASAAPQWLVPQYQYGYQYPGQYLYPGMYPGMYPAIADPRIQTAAAATNPLQRGIIGIEALQASASKSSIRRFVITEKAPTRAFSWLKAATTAFT